MTGFRTWRVAAAWFAACLLFQSCRSPDERLALFAGEREKIELSQRLELLRYRYDQDADGGGEALAGIRETRLAADLKLRQATRRRVELETEIRDLENRTTELAEMIRAERRMAAIGRRFETFPGGDGRRFQEVVVTSVDDIGIAFRHKYGAARVRFWDLSPELRDWFGLDEDSAIAAAERERREAAIYDRRIAREIAIREAAAQAALLVRNDKPQTSGFAMEREPLGRSMGALSRPAEPVGGRRSRCRHSRFRTYRPRYVHVSYPCVRRPIVCGTRPALRRVSIPSPIIRESP